MIAFAFTSCSLDSLTNNLSNGLNDISQLRKVFKYTSNHFQNDNEFTEMIKKGVYLYDWMNCLDISPCWGWMNSNETIRNLTSERAANLTQVFIDIIGNQSYKNFDMTFFPFPMAEVLKFFLFFWSFFYFD